MHDLVVIGKGPAGLSAAIYAVRAGLTVLVIGRDSGALQKAEKIENYFGFIETLSGASLLDKGLKQAQRLGIEIITEEVTGISWQESFSVHTSHQSYAATSVILATGMTRKKASVAGLSQYEGKGVSYCATCDGFFYRGKTVAVIGDGDYAFQEASELIPFAAQINLLTNGRPYKGRQGDEKILIDERKIISVNGAEKVESLTFDDEQVMPADGIFVAEGTASALDLALKLGLENDGKSISADLTNQATNLPGIYAAGDCTGGLLQIAVAVGEGARAGLSAASYVKELRGEKAVKVQW